MKSIWKDLLFLHGHITDPRILESAAPAAPPVTGKLLPLPTPVVRTAAVQRSRHLRQGLAGMRLRR